MMKKLVLLYINGLILTLIIGLNFSHAATCEMTSKEISNVRAACAVNNNSLIFQIHNENESIVVSYLDFKIKYGSYEGIIRAHSGDVWPKQVSSSFYSPAPASLRGRTISSAQLSCSIDRAFRLKQGFFDWC